MDGMLVAYHSVSTGGRGETVVSNTINLPRPTSAIAEIFPVYVRHRLRLSWYSYNRFCRVHRMYNGRRKSPASTELSFSSRGIPLRPT